MKLILGENLKRLRLGKDMTQEQFAEMLGVSFQSVSRWENRESIASAIGETLKRISE